MISPLSVPLLILSNWYWSLSWVVLEYQVTDTGVTLMWYREGILKA